MASSHQTHLSILAVRRRPLRRLILRPVTTIRRLRRLQLDIVVTTSVGRGVIVRRRRVVAVVVVRLLCLRRLVLVLVLRVLRILRPSRVISCLAVAWRCAAESPAGAAVRLVAALSATAGGDTSLRVLVDLRWMCVGVFVWVDLREEEEDEDCAEDN